MFIMPMPFMGGQQNNPQTLSNKDLKRFVKAFMQAQKEMEAGGTKKPDEKKPDASQPRMTAKEMFAWTTMLSPIIGLGMINLYVYCFNQIKLVLSTVH